MCHQQLNCEYYQMLKNKLKELVRVYWKLPYIIHKKQYLIPQRPMRPHVNNLIGVHQNIVGIYRQSFPELVNEEFIKRVGDPTQRQSLIDEYRQRLNEKILNYKQQMEQYLLNYILPFKPCGINPALTYYRLQKKQFQQCWKKEGKKYSLAYIYNRFKQLPEETKNIYFSKAKQEKQQKIKINAEACQKYKIPDLKGTLPHIMYLREVKQGAIKPEMYTEYKQLPLQIKMIYKEKIAQIKRHKQNQLIKFLAQRNLTVNDFNSIKAICEQIQLLKKQLKKQKAANKSTSIKDKGILNDQDLSDQDILQNIAQLKDINASNLEVNKVEKLSNNAKQSQPQKSQTKQPALTKDSLEDDNFDFTDSQVNILELKRIAALKRAVKK